MSEECYKMAEFLNGTFKLGLSPSFSVFDCANSDQNSVTNGSPSKRQYGAELAAVREGISQFYFWGHNAGGRTDCARWKFKPKSTSSILTILSIAIYWAFVLLSVEDLFCFV